MNKIMPRTASRPKENSFSYLNLIEIYRNHLKYVRRPIDRIEFNSIGYLVLKKIFLKEKQQFWR